MRKKRFLFMLALLLTAAVGARAQTTYTLTVKGDTEDAARWSATPNPAGEGQSVTVKYNGKKKVKRVTAVKAAAAHPQVEGHALTAAALGEIVGSDGMAYAVADKDNLPTFVTAVAMIAYVGSETEHPTYKHGLAIALSDESGKMNWFDAKGACERKAAFNGAAWMLPSENQWNTMISAAGSYTALRDGFVSVGGTNMQADYYWSSTEYDSYSAWLYNFSRGSWPYDLKDNDHYVRACLAF